MQTWFCNGFGCSFVHVYSLDTLHSVICPHNQFCFAIDVHRLAAGTRWKCTVECTFYHLCTHVSLYHASCAHVLHMLRFHRSFVTCVSACRSNCHIPLLAHLRLVGVMKGKVYHKNEVQIVPQANVVTDMRPKTSILSDSGYLLHRARIG